MINNWVGFNLSSTNYFHQASFRGLPVSLLGAGVATFLLSALPPVAAVGLEDNSNLQNHGAAAIKRNFAMAAHDRK